MKKFRALSCFVIALCLVFYAVPRLPFQGISQMATGFSFIWITFALLVVGSNLMYAIGTDGSGPRKGQRRQASYQSLRKPMSMPTKSTQGTRSLFKQ